MYSKVEGLVLGKGKDLTEESQERTKIIALAKS